MPATGSSSIPATGVRLCPVSSQLAATFALTLACLPVVRVAFVLPAYLLLVFGLVLLLAAGILLNRALAGRTPRRLTPIGLAGNLAVRLRGDSLMVGRLPCCSVEIPLPTVSSHHCRLARRGSRWYIEDLDSRNGTFVNGRRIRRRWLHVGDRITVGEFSFRVD